jgi:small nuclear ribonucleoprotein (snRNP)-like protein
MLALSSECAVLSSPGCAKVVTKSKREFFGSFTCLDHFGYVVLFDAFEKATIGGDTFERALNQIIIHLDLIESASVLVRSVFNPVLCICVVLMPTLSLAQFSRDVTCFRPLLEGMLEVQHPDIWVC